MKRVLLIEDDNVLRENTAELLQLAQYEVLSASEGRKGIELARHNHPDVIVCDIMMPGIDGYQVLETLAGDQETQRIPFIFFHVPVRDSEIVLKHISPPLPLIRRI